MYSKQLQLEIKQIIDDQKWNKTIEKFDYYEEWEVVSLSYNSLSEEFMTTFQNKLNWFYVSANNEMTELFMEKLQNEIITEQRNIDVNWVNFSKYQKLSESFIRKFQNKVDWNYISACQKLSEPLIKEFKNKVDWYYILLSQNLSENFIWKFRKYINLNDFTTYEINQLNQKYNTNLKDFLNPKLPKNSNPFQLLDL